MQFLSLFAISVTQLKNYIPPSSRNYHPTIPVPYPQQQFTKPPLSTNSPLSLTSNLTGLNPPPRPQPTSTLFHSTKPSPPTCYLPSSTTSLSSASSRLSATSGKSSCTPTPAAKSPACTGREATRRVSRSAATAGQCRLTPDVLPVRGREITVRGRALCRRRTKFVSRCHLRV